MYVDPFVMGVLCTIGFELLGIVVFVVYSALKMSAEKKDTEKRN